MKFVRIEFKTNGFEVVSDGFVKNNGQYIFKSTEEKELLEHIGRIIFEKKIEVIEK